MKLNRFSFLALLSLFGCTSALAGTLDPRLVTLLAGKATLTRSSTGNHVLFLNPFRPRLDNAGRVQVYVHPANITNVQIVAAELQTFGAVHIVSSPVMRVVQAWVPVSALKSLSSLAYVSRVSIPAYAVARHVPPLLRFPLNRNGYVMTRGVPTGLAIDSQALTAMQASLLIANDAKGAGVKVGVISSDNSGLTASQAAGYLPPSVWADPNFPGTTPTPGDPAEGTAMLEEVHVMAPEASLGFCAPKTSVDLLTCYNDLIAWGANVVTDDLEFTGVDMFSAGLSNDGSLAYAVSQITQAHPDVAFTSAGGNDAQDYFQAAYTPGPGATIDGTTYTSLMDFGEASGGASLTKLAVTFGTTSTFTPLFEWNDPLNTSPDVLNVFLVNSSGTVLSSGAPEMSSNGRVGESLSYTPTSAGETDYVEIACKSCVNPITLKLNGFGDGAISFDLITGGSIGYGQAIAQGVMAIAAASVGNQNPLYIDQEQFSATGPFLYGNFGATNTETRPNLTGIDNITVSGAGGFAAGNPAPGGGVLFLGTSAAAPNVSALIADLMAGNSGQTAGSYYAALENTANQTAFSPYPYNVNADGSGLGQGVAAWDSISSNLIPYISDLNPTSDTVGAAFGINVNGGGFASGSTVEFNGSTLVTTFVNLATLGATVPASVTATAGTFNIQIINPAPANTISNTLPFTLYNPIPVLDSPTPYYAMAGAATFVLTLNGISFVNGAVASLNGIAQPTTFVSNTQITVTVPASDIVTAGTLSVQVSNPAPTQGPSTGFNFFIYNPVPTLISITPACAAVGGPAFTLTLNGTGFIGGNNGTSVWFGGGFPLTNTVLSSTEMTAIVPASAIAALPPSGGFVPVNIQNYYQGPGASVNTTQGFTVTSNNSPPTLSNFNPANTMVGDGGFTLTISGSGFINGAAVDFNSALLPTAFVSATQLTAVVSASAVMTAGSYPVTIMNPSPNCGYSNTDIFAVQAPPTPPSQLPPTSPPPKSSGGGGGSFGLFELVALGLCLMALRCHLET